jgi:hypothetical protein
MMGIYTVKGIKIFDSPYKIYVREKLSRRTQIKDTCKEAAAE